MPLEAKASLIEGAVNPKSLYDCSVAHITKRNLRNMRTRVTHAVWGRGKFRCQEILFTVLTRGHAVDPLQARVMRIMKSVQRMLKRHDGQRAKWSSVLCHRTRHGSRLQSGPVAQFLWALRQMGWQVSENDLHVYNHTGQ